MRTISGTLRPTPLAWLPVLSNIPPPHLRRTEATSKMLRKVRANMNLPLYTDITCHPALRLPSRRPIWWNQPEEDFTAIAAWSVEWATTEVVNRSLVDVPSVWPLGHSLPRGQWVTLNRFRTGQGRCAANLVRWGQAMDPMCNCGEIQTMAHIVNDCVITRFPGGMTALHEVDEAAVEWLCANCKS